MTARFKLAIQRLQKLGPVRIGGHFDPAGRSTRWAILRVFKECEEAAALAVGWFITAHEVGGEFRILPGGHLVGLEITVREEKEGIECAA